MEIAAVLIAEMAPVKEIKDVWSLSSSGATPQYISTAPYELSDWVAQAGSQETRGFLILVIAI